MLDHRRRTTRRTALFADTLEDDSPRRISYYSLSRFVLLSPPFFSLSLSHTHSPSFSLLLPMPLSWSHDSDSLSPRIFRLRATSINDGSARFYRRGQGRPRSTLTPTPFTTNGLFTFSSRSIDIFVRFETDLSFSPLFADRSPNESSRVEFRFETHRRNLAVFFFLPLSDLGREERGGGKIVLGARFVVSRENMESLETCFETGTRTTGGRTKRKNINGIRLLRSFRLSCFLSFPHPSGGGMKGNFWSGFDRLYGV